jgi:tetratricopeptide (TPR) repeat protein
LYIVRIMKTIISIITLITVGLNSPIFCQNYSAEKQQIVDSLTSVINSPSSHDTSKISAMYNFGEQTYLLRISYWDTIVQLAEKKLTKAKGNKELEEFFKKYKARSLNNIGYIYKEQSNLLMALENYQKSLAIQKELDDLTGLATAYNNIGFIYKTQGDIPLAIDYYLKALKIREELKEERGIASTLINIGMVYNSQAEYDMAIDYFEKSLSINKQMGDKKGEANSLNNIGLAYKEMGNYDLSLEFYQKSLAIREEIGEPKAISQSLHNIGSIYYNTKNYDLGLEYLEKSFAIDDFAAADCTGHGVPGAMVSVMCSNAF